MIRPLRLLLLAALAAGCTAPGVSAPDNGPASARPASVPAPSASPSPSSTDARTGLDTEALRQALLGPSPVPPEQEDFVDEVMAVLDRALEELPPTDGLPADEAACATWRPLVGKLRWVGGAVVERQIALAHLGQLASVAPDAIRPAAEEAVRIAARAAREQLVPDGDMAIVNTIPGGELRSIGAWALEHCELDVPAEADPDTEDWTEADFEYSCELDRSLLERGMDEYRDGPGNGAYATHPHELELHLEYFGYPAWHRLGAVDNEAEPPTFEIEPIAGGHCDR